MTASDRFSMACGKSQLVHCPDARNSVFVEELEDVLIVFGCAAEVDSHDNYVKKSPRDGFLVKGIYGDAGSLAPLNGQLSQECVNEGSVARKNGYWKREFPCELAKIRICCCTGVRVLEGLLHVVHMLVKEWNERMGPNTRQDVVDTGEGSVEGRLDCVVGVVMIRSFVL